MIRCAAKANFPGKKINYRNLHLTSETALNYALQLALPFLKHKCAASKIEFKINVQ